MKIDQPELPLMSASSETYLNSQISISGSNFKSNVMYVVGERYGTYGVAGKC